ncbi:Gluconate transporter [Methanohalobium evestigatum Z-7303]|uniref:Gluconate transporter n=1 Tax=Methanohalobium evestigatum (strain ATCC BAA-1072 / DSM 3721 / NBRC 107634 / OCM 161 / Z-7303) TaxID=644295 RepID=D7E817_METEZ|nr:GntP family permease [Methanohalobium evestigatum]ADI73359.1 Gluconate transporter [Methanohalobium evestigatum Z-7303]
MNPVIIFLIALITVLVMTTKLRVHPFLSLITASIVVGILDGNPLDALNSVSLGLGRVFSQFAIIITCGSIIGLILFQTGGTAIIADDLIRFSRKPLFALNLLGFLFAVPVMCSILAYVIFIPIAKDIGSRLNIPKASVAASLGLGTLASFNMVYPSPVIFSAAEELGANTGEILLTGLPVAVIVTIVGYYYAKISCNFGPPPVINPSEAEDNTQGLPRINRIEAYSPICIPVILILSGVIINEQTPLINFISNRNIALLIGVMLAFISARSLGLEQIKNRTDKAVRRSGVVLLDMCGGGALGTTLSMTGIGKDLGQMFTTLNLPDIIIPFMVAVAIQSVQGSRIVTMLVAPSIVVPFLPELNLPASITLLSMASGTFLISHVNDPYFWIFGELIELKTTEIFRSYTIGGVLMGFTGLVLTYISYTILY